MNVIWYLGSSSGPGAPSESALVVGTDDGGEDEAVVELYRFWIHEMCGGDKRVRAVGQWEIADRWKAETGGVWRACKNLGTGRPRVGRSCLKMLLRL